MHLSDARKGKLSGFFPDSSIEGAQGFSSNGVVEESEDSKKREKFNLSLPPELMAELNRFSETFGPKRKWVGFATAVLMLVEAPESVQKDFSRRVREAEWEGTFPDLVREAKERRKHAVPSYIISGELGGKATPKARPPAQTPRRARGARR